MTSQLVIFRAFIKLFSPPDPRSGKNSCKSSNKKIWSKCPYDLDGKWIHENPTVVVNPGDTVNYWVYEIVNGLPRQALDQTWTVGKFPFVEDTTMLLPT